MKELPVPTKKAVIDVGRKCNVNCKFCYYHHLGDLRKQTFKSFEELCADILKAVQRGNEYLDITGGEPTIFQYMPQLLRYAEAAGIKNTRIITNATAGPNTAEKLARATKEPPSFLLSIHGTEAVHDDTVMPGARKRQERFIETVKRCGCAIDANCVINSRNQSDLEQVSEYVISQGIRTMNFINMNPHGEWAADVAGTRKAVADFTIAEPCLNAAITKLKAAGILVNVRYYPMCKIAVEHRGCICNDYHVAFDRDEWDYEIQPKTYAAFRKWAVMTSNNIECKDGACGMCTHLFVCGGINRAFRYAVGGNVVKPLTDTIPDPYDFMHYRRANV